MKKKNKIALIAGIVLVVVILGVLAKQGLFKLPFALTTLSVSDVEVKDQGSRILATITPQGSDMLEIEFNPESMNPSLKKQGYIATKSSILTANYIKSSKKFYFSNTELNPIKLVSTKDVPGITVFCRKSLCPSVTNQEVLSAFAVGVGGCRCIYSYTNGYINSFTGFSSDGFKVEFDLDGEKKYISTNAEDMKQRIDFGSSSIEWAGSLLTINNIGTPSADVFHVGTSWFLIDKQASAKVSLAYSEFKSCLTNYPSKAIYEKCSTIYWNVVNTYIDSSSNARKKYERELGVNSISFEKGIMYLDLKDPTSMPLFRVSLDAKKVRLIKIKGQPEIQNCIEDTTFERAGSKVLSATIVNTADTEGFFDFTIKCDNPLISGYAESKNFDAKESKNVNFYMSGGNTGKSTNTGRCILNVQDREDNLGANTRKCNFDIAVEYSPDVEVCSESKCTEDLKFLLKCENKQITKIECAEKCSYINNKAQCTAGGEIIIASKCQSCQDFAISSILGSLWQEKKCEAKLLQTYTTCVFSFIQLFLIPIVFIFALLFGKDLFSSFKSLRKREAISWILSLITAGILAYLVFIAFWIGLGIFAIYIVIRIIIAGTLGKIKYGLKMLR